MSQPPSESPDPKDKDKPSVLPDIVIDKTNGTRVELEMSPVEWVIVFIGLTVLLGLANRIGLV